MFFGFVGFVRLSHVSCIFPKHFHSVALRTYLTVLLVFGEEVGAICGAFLRFGGASGGSIYTTVSNAQ